MDMAGIARYVFRNNANPRLCALVPHIKPNYEVGVSVGVVYYYYYSIFSVCLLSSCLIWKISDSFLLLLCHTQN